MNIRTVREITTMGGKKIKALLFEPDKAPRQIEIKEYDDLEEYIGCECPSGIRVNTETELFYSDAIGAEYDALPYTTTIICGEYSGDCTEDRYTFFELRGTGVMVGIEEVFGSLDEHTLNWYMSGEHLI